MRRIFKAIADFWAQYQNAKDVELYLAQSSDRTDLERRIKHLQRNGKL